MLDKFYEDVMGKLDEMGTKGKKKVSPEDRFARIEQALGLPPADAEGGAAPAAGASPAPASPSPSPGK